MGEAVKTTGRRANLWRRGFLIRCGLLASFLIACAVGGLVARKATAEPKGATFYPLAPLELEATRGFFAEVQEVNRKLEERFERNVVASARDRLVRDQKIDPRSPVKLWRDEKTNEISWLVGEAPPIAPVTSAAAIAPVSSRG